MGRVLLPMSWLRLLEALGGKLYSFANHLPMIRVAFAGTYGVEKVYQEIDEVFKRSWEVDIIYISTPHNTHINFLLQGTHNG